MRSDPAGGGAASPRSVDPEILALLRAASDSDGFIAFDRFMEIALYTEGVGYYSRDRTPFGPAGDFYTAAAVHPIFAQTIAARIRSVLSGLRTGRPRRVVEVGPGDGSLAAQVAAALGRSDPPVGHLDYLLVERSGRLRDRAVEAARAASRGTTISVGAAPSVAADGPFAGVIFANELLDAQPARRLEYSSTGWSELGVRVDGDQIRPARSSVRPVPGPSLPVSPPEGTIFELSPAAEGIVREIGDHLVDGTAILVDFGMEEPELLAGHPRGTLQTLREHRANADPLAAAGAADLSVFVNFSRVRDAARRAGLREVAFRSQAEALGAWGFPTLLEEAIRAGRTPEAEVRTRLAAKSLLFGFERFRVLELAPQAGAATRRPMS